MPTPVDKTNYGKLVKTNLYELLLYFNDEMMYGCYDCIVECLRDEFIYDDNNNRCYQSDDKNCSECIQKWLKEESK